MRILISVPNRMTVPHLGYFPFPLRFVCQWTFANGLMVSFAENILWKDNMTGVRHVFTVLCPPTIHGSAVLKFSLMVTHSQGNNYLCCVASVEICVWVISSPIWSVYCNSISSFTCSFEWLCGDLCYNKKFEIELFFF